MARALFLSGEFIVGWFDVSEPPPPTWRLVGRGALGEQWVDEYERGWFRDTDDPRFVGTLAYRRKYHDTRDWPAQAPRYEDQHLAEQE